MLNLKVKHKLLAIWLGSVIFALVLVAGLFRYQIAGLHEQEANSSITSALESLHKELEMIVARIGTSAHALANRSDIVASMNLIDRYQDPDNYQAVVFDGEKQQLAQALSQHALATNTDVLALRDTKNVLAAFYLSPAAGGQGAGYVVFNDGQPQTIYLNNSETPVAGTPKLIDDTYPRSNDAASVLSYTDGPHLALSTLDKILRKTVNSGARPVGSITAGKLLDADFQTSMQRLAGMQFRVVPPKGTIEPPLPGIDFAMLEGELSSLVLDGVVNHQNAIEHSWFTTDDFFVGAFKLRINDGRNVSFLFAQRTNALESTLTTFQNTVILVLVLSGLLVLPVGVFFLNRTISKPVENLVGCVDQLRRGEDIDVAVFSGTDEFSTLAHAFEDMAAAVHARETALRESKSSLKNAQRIARLGSWEWTPDTNIIKLSEEALVIFQRPAQSMGGTFEGFMSCVHPDDLHMVKRRFTEALQSNEPFSVEHRILLPDGSERFVVETGEIHRDADNGATRITATVQDITERHMLEQAKSELISTVSHELRTPLTSIIGTLGLAVGGVMGELPDRLRGMLATADKNAKRLSALIDDLLDMEKLANGAMNFEFRPLSLATIVRKAQAANQAYAQNLGASIRIDGDIPKAKIYGDADRLAQVMANLLSNACKFTPEGGQVVISSQCTADKVAISITDFGPGIPEAFEPQVFARFAQADQTLTRQDQRGGTGLGLAITKAIVDMHDGDITFTTRRAPASDHGTTFTVSLPQWHDGADKSESAS
ncbi:MAG TPA: ATP-binding protein [Magnetovibrio sp.]